MTPGQLLDALLRQPHHDALTLRVSLREDDWSVYELVSVTAAVGNFGAAVLKQARAITLSEELLAATDLPPDKFAKVLDESMRKVQEFNNAQNHAPPRSPPHQAGFAGGAEI